MDAFFPPNTRNKFRCLLSPLLNHTIWEVLENGARWGGVKGMETGKKEAKFSLFAKSIFWWIENSKESTNKLLELMTKFNKVTKY